MFGLNLVSEQCANLLLMVKSLQRFSRGARQGGGGHIWAPLLSKSSLHTSLQTHRSKWGWSTQDHRFWFWSTKSKLFSTPPFQRDGSCMPSSSRPPSSRPPPAPPAKSSTTCSSCSAGAASAKGPGRSLLKHYLCQEKYFWLSRFKAGQEGPLIAETLSCLYVFDWKCSK